jgi:hypothetical protein
MASHCSGCIGDARKAADKAAADAAIAAQRAADQEAGR